MKTDKIFADMLSTIMNFGDDINTRNSVTRRYLHLSTRFDSTPLISVRKTAWKLALREFEWFLSGSNNINDLHPSVRHWWQPWADSNGLIANNYSIQFRDFVGHHGSVDQVKYLIDGIKYHPYSRRNIITTWNTSDMINQSTPITNCHGSLISAFVQPDKSLHLSMVQRSSDMVLGMPHNWIQYWAFLMYLAKRSDTAVGSLIWTGEDCHIYQNHEDAASKIISSDLSAIKTPNLIYRPTSEDFKADDFSLDSEYKPLISEKLVMTI
jgi:thymidylate synthase